MMTDHSPVRGSLVEVIRNEGNLYTGNLNYYFRTLFEHATNLNHPYHNWRHMTHVTWLCYEACRFYREKMEPWEMRNLLIAAIFHDFDHSGKFKDDRENIELALSALNGYALGFDRPYLPEIGQLIRVTQYPYPKSTDSLSLSEKIIRDADVSQAFSAAWIQQVVFGLAAEWGKSPTEVLQMQEPFLSNIRFETDWAKAHFPPHDVEAKIAEAHALVQILCGEQ